MQEQWQKDQAAKCPCRGSDEMCPCQNVRFGDRPPRAEELLDWMTHHHLPIHIFREEDGCWVAVDASRDTVMGSGGTALEALATAYSANSDQTEPSPMASGS